MRFKHVIIVREQNGTEDALTTEYPKETILIGRGSGCDIILKSRFVSLTHAQLTWRAGKVILEDAGSLGGVSRNGKVVNSSPLEKGDTITLGNVVLTLSFIDDQCILTERRMKDGSDELDAKIATDLKKITTLYSLPQLHNIGLVAAALIMVFFLIAPFGSDTQPSWSAGPIANVHHTFSKECTTCHTGEFDPIPDSKCQSCHSLTPHAAPFKNISFHPEGDCVSCHKDHNGDRGLIIAQPKLCTNCHGDLKRVYKEANVRDLNGWEAHPEFAIPVVMRNTTGEILSSKFVRLDNRSEAVDTAQIKFNHRIHLKGPLDTKGGPKKVLECRDCHIPSGQTSSPYSKNGGLMAPISFERHCRSCHTLDFDSRLPGKEVPHGNANIVFDTLYSAYASIAIAADSDARLQESFKLREIPGKMSEEKKKARARDFALKESREAEKLLFTKTACGTCHTVSEIPAKGEHGMDGSHYTVTPPFIPKVWLPRARFSHTAHEYATCDSCHKGVRESEKTSDVFLPSVKVCTECHASVHQDKKVKSDCILCHSFHDSLPLAPDKKPVSVVAR